MSNLIDTLTIDTSTIAQMRSSGKYDYYSQKLPIPEDDSRNLDIDLPDLPSSELNPEVAKIVMIVIFAIIIGLVVYYMYKNGVFSRNKKVKKSKKEDDSSAEGLDISGIDFAKELSEAKREGRWNDAVRLCYLQTLHDLNENNVVVWQLHKTPTEYSIEAGDVSFTNMTNLFLRIRYGLFDASEDDVNDMERWQLSVRKGGGDEK